MDAAGAASRRARMVLMSELRLLADRIEDYRCAVDDLEPASALAAGLSSLVGDLAALVAGGMPAGMAAAGRADDLARRAGELAAPPFPDETGRRLAGALGRLTAEARGLAAPEPGR